MKVIGSDFDGTITTNKVILDETRKQIKRFRDNGNVFIIVTGRSPKKFKDGIKKYNIDFFDYVICANGAVILNNQLEVIKINSMNKKAVNEVITLLFNNDQQKEITVNTLYESFTITKFTDLNAIDDNIISLSISFNSIEQRKNQQFLNIDDIAIYHNTIYTDILASNISKASQLLDLYHDLSGDELYTIGDGENDICMLECCKNSYSFNHVDSIVKNSANYLFDNIDQILIKINNN